MKFRAAVLAAAVVTATGAQPSFQQPFQQLRKQLPEPILDAKPQWVAAYWKAWEIASHNFHDPAPGSDFPSRFIDAAFSDNIYFWDTCFMTMFTNVAAKLVPGIESLDNFYAKQHADGEIAREIVRATGEDYPKWVNTERLPFFSRWGWDGFGPKMKVLGPDDPVEYIGRKPPARIPDLTLDSFNHPIAAWAEMESFRYTGDRARLAHVYAPLAKYYAFLRQHLRQGNGLYMTDWASMDDSPRNIYLKGGGTGVDTSSEMVLFARELAEMADLLSNAADARRYREEADDLARVINRQMWNAEKQFYFDLKLHGEQAPAKTIAGLWPLIARVATREQAGALQAHLRNPKTFGTPHRVPAVAADDPAYRAGIYWQGAVWAPTNTMVIRGLEANGAQDLAREIALEHLSYASATLEQTGTIWENYSPEAPAPGRPARKDFVGWSGIAPILYLLEYGVGLTPDAPHNRLTWNLAQGGRAGCLRYRFNGHVADLIAENGRIRVTSDGPFELIVNGVSMSIKAGTQVMLAPGLPQIQAPDRLRCEYLANPTAIDVAAPRFSWVPRHGGNDQIQTAYQIVVTGSAAAIAWDSGKVSSRETSQIAYAGATLRSHQSYTWRVRYWDRDGAASPYSDPATFVTGLLSPSEWKAYWITGGNELHYQFTIASPIRRARVFVSAIGLYELTVNGNRAGNSVLDPAWTDFRKRALYSSYEISGFLRRDQNAIDVRLGHGRAKTPAFLLQLHIETDRGEQLIVTGPDWQCRDGAIKADSLYDGEIYDARPITAPWRPVTLATDPPARLSAQMIPPISVTDTFATQRVAPNICDAGRLISGWARIEVEGPAGAEVKLRFAEKLAPDGTLDRSTLRNARAEDTYILRGGGLEAWEPAFTYHGFRYIEVTGPPLKSIQARVVNSAIETAASFHSSNELLNRLQTAIQWTLRTNFHGIPTDNNQRDERLGWLGDAHVTADVASSNFDLAALYTKFLADIADAQRPDGQLPNVVPVAEFNGVWDSDPAWESAYPLLCWHMYREYGDRRIIEQHFQGVKRLVDRLRRVSGDALLTNGRFGDWVALEDTPPNLVANFYFIQDVEILARMSELLGRAALAVEYREFAERLRRDYRTAFSNGHSQTALALAIELGDTSAGPALVENIEQHQRHLTTGMIGTRFLLPALTKVGRSDLAFAILDQRTYPGWGYMLENGATALWELWRFDPAKRMKSHNQPMLASAGAWLFEGLAGIHAEAPAYRRIVIDPQSVAGLENVTATRNTIAGDIAVSWTRTSAGIELDLTVPVNVVADVKGHGAAGSGRHHIRLKGRP